MFVIVDYRVMYCAVACSRQGEEAEEELVVDWDEQSRSLYLPSFVSHACHTSERVVDVSQR